MSLISKERKSREKKNIRSRIALLELLEQETDNMENWGKSLPNWWYSLPSSAVGTKGSDWLIARPVRTDQ
jgi:hypothetical protein